MRRTRILIADAVPIFRTGVRNLLLREGDFEVLEAATLADVEQHTAQPPEIALIDLELPPSGGIAAASRMSYTRGTQTIVWSFSPTREAVFDAIRGGASGYLHKEISPRGLIRALRGLTAGEAPLARDLAALMISGLHDMEQRAGARERAAALSMREREVLELLATGARNKQIAGRLVISEFTVKRHVQNILQKLGLPTRQAAAGFYRAAFGSDEAPAVFSQSA